MTRRRDERGEPEPPASRVGAFASVVRGAVSDGASGESASGDAEVARAYDRWSTSYDDDANATRDLDAAVLRRAPLALAGRDVLELGCGTGKNTAWLAAHAGRVIAIDLSAGMLARARERVASPRVSLVRHDVTAPWPLPDGSIDVVVGNLVLEHVRDMRPVFAEAARVLRAGGQVFACELHPFRQWRGGRAHFTDRDTGETVHVPVHVHTVGEFVNAGIAAGLVLRDLGEWLEPAAPPDAPPRLLSVLFERR